MKLPFLAVSPSTTSSSFDHHHHHHLPKTPLSPWHWTACGNLETLSFRATLEDSSTFNVDPPPSSTVIHMGDEAPASCLTISSPESSRSLSGSDDMETVIRGLRSDRLFFEPGESNSILEEANMVATAFVAGCSSDPAPFNESTVFLSMESNDPFMDFRTSMEEMIEAHGLRDWECLEELLAWYLKVNGKSNHGYIIDAFVDLLVTFYSSSSFSPPPPPRYSPCSMSSPVRRRSGLASASGRLMETTTTATATTSSSFSCTSPSSPLSLPSSSLTTPCLSSLLDQVDENDEDENGEENSHLPPPPPPLQLNA